MVLERGVVYERGAFRETSPEEVRATVSQEGWEPLLVRDAPGAIYPEHEHVEDKLLVFLEGSMMVETGGKTYHCEPGDRLVIPGSQRHAAWVGSEGCAFLWSEQIRRTG